MLPFAWRCLSHWIDEAIPLKQGLKPKTPTRIINTQGIDEAIPLKQGLKHLWCDVQMGKYCIDEAIPLKQGLKHSSSASPISLLRY